MQIIYLSSKTEVDVRKSENYRPVSLTSVICKMLQSLLRDHMVNFILRHSLINQTQHGFLKGRSCNLL